MEGDYINNRLSGNKKEKLAAEYLKKNGLSIVKMNFYSKMGEIDIVADDKGCLVFVEVKYRKTASKGHPEEAVNYYKARKICRAADYYILKNNIKTNTNFRFDVIAIEGEDIRWYKNAFDYM